MSGNGTYLLFDFDGTLHENGVVLPETYEALDYARSKGCKLFVNTGRTKYGLLEDFNKIINYEFDGLLCGGSSVYTGKNYDTVLFEQQPLSDAEVEKFIRFACKKSMWSFIEGNDSNYLIRIHGEKTYTLAEKERFYHRAMKVYKKTRPFKVAIFPPIGQTIPELQEELPEFDWVVHTARITYEGFAKGCGKDKVIKKFADTLGITTDDIISFGDSQNDLPAFRASGKSVAMASSPEDVKKEATFVATGKAGVAEGIYHYVK